MNRVLEAYRAELAKAELWLDEQIVRSLMNAVATRGLMALRPADADRPAMLRH